MGKPATKLPNESVLLGAALNEMEPNIPSISSSSHGVDLSPKLDGVGISFRLIAPV
jgi:hypothetical protein